MEGSPKGQGMAAKKIIIDTDPGQDDAVAILLALGSPEVELIGITCVAGNVPLALTTRNARIVCELAGRPDIPVFAGCDRPMARPLVTAEHVHGKTGLDGADLPEPSMPLQEAHAVDYLIDTLRREPPGTVTLCPIGPLTNIATALDRAPDIAARIARIVLMGGAYFEVGNITPAAEFNIYVDPHAADIVFRCGAPITMFGLDVTHKVLVTEPRLRAIAAIGTPVARAAAGLLDFYSRFDRERYGEPGGPLHDPCVIAHLIDPTLFRGRACPVTIEREGSCAGRTVVDWWNMHRHPATATVMREVDAERFFALLTERLARL
jgi:purine nucleosidase